METRANYIVTGLFTLLALMFGFIFIYWVAKIDEQVNLVPVSVKIRGAVTGLSPGSEVHFNGIKVGKVSRIVFDQEDPSVVSALVRIDETTPVRMDTRATIASNGLTGTALIALTGGSKGSPALFDQEVEDGKFPEIDATPSAISDIVETVREVADKANNTLASIEGLVEDNRKPLTSTFKSAEIFSKSLSDNSDGIDKFLKSTADLGETINALSTKLDGTISGVEGVVKAVSPKKIASIIDNAESFSANLKTTGEQLDKTLASVDKISNDLERFSGSLNASLEKLDKVIGAVEPDQVKSTMANISSVATDAKQVALDAKQIVQDVKGVTQTIAGRKDEINKIVTDAAEMTARLNASSARVDGVLAKLDGFLGEGDASTLMSDARSTLLEFKGVAANLNTRINQISGGINQFTSSGLKDVQSLVNDSRRSINRIERVISDLERDPSGFLFGKSGVKTYNGRPRR